ncbi:hypothetical protein D3C84_958210 [compost metagenome]
MPKVFKYSVGDDLTVKGSPDHGNKVKVTELLYVSNYDYKCRFENGQETKFYESELHSINSFPFKLDNIVQTIHTQEEGRIIGIDYRHEQVEVEFHDSSWVYSINKIEKVSR